MALFTFDDTVRVKESAPLPKRHGACASVIMVFEDNGRAGSYFEQFPPGVVYSIEFEDGEAEDVHETHLEIISKSSKAKE